MRAVSPRHGIEATEGYRIIDAKGFPLVRVYHGADSGLTEDETRRMAVNIAKLPELLGAAS